MEKDEPRIPKTSGLAIASLILSVLGLACFLFTAIPGVICGHLALGRIRRSEGAQTGSGLAIAGLVIGYFMSVMGLLTVPALLIPTIMGAREKADQAVCERNVQLLGTAMQLYAQDNDGAFPSSFEALGGYLQDPTDFECPAQDGPGDSYEIVFTGKDPAPGTALIRETEARHKTRDRRVARHFGYVDSPPELVAD